MHHLSPMLRREVPVKERSSGCQVLVRFFALLRIKPHAPLLVRVPVNSFEFYSCERTPQAEHSRAYIDLCNPESGYAPETSENSIELVPGEKHSYNVYLNPARYTVEAGHCLAVVIGTEDPVNCLIHKKYSVEIDNASVKADIPMV